MTYQLIPTEKGSGPSIPLHRPVLLIGRHPECDIRIDLPKISRRHCCVALAYDRVLIRDLGSHNGLRVNGRVVDEARLHVGDELAIGPLIYRLVLEPEQAALPVHPTARPVTGTSPKPGNSLGGIARPGVPLPAPDDSSDMGLVPLEDF